MIWQKFIGGDYGYVAPPRLHTAQKPTVLFWVDCALCRKKTIPTMTWWTGDNGRIFLYLGGYRNSNGIYRIELREVGKAKPIHQDEHTFYQIVKLRQLEAYVR